MRRLTFLLLFSIDALIARSQQVVTSIDFSAGTSLNLVYYQSKNDLRTKGGGATYSISNGKPLAGLVARFSTREKLGKNIFTRLGIGFGNYRTNLIYNLHEWAGVFTDCYYLGKYGRVSYSDIELPATLGFYMDRKHIASVSFGFVPKFLISNQSIWKYESYCYYHYPPDTPYTVIITGEKKLKVKSNIAFELGFAETFPAKATWAIIVEERFQYGLGHIVEDPPIKQFDIELAVGLLFNLKEK